ncbi:hypothetical protein GOV09_05390 [Candidatus Woesearchaeota archaeon]|nr:hypothetical protein [Candidatus Woesearchaeota archaeon]
MEDYAQKVAGYLGGDLAPHIRNLVDQSNEGMFLFHGIKHGKDLETIADNGLKPLTPEGGQCSCWSTGQLLFSPAIASSFFSYSGGPSEDGRESSLSMVLTTIDAIKEAGLQIPTFYPDGNVHLHETVPPEALYTIGIRTYHEPADTNEEHRANRVIGEMVLLQEIEKSVRDFKPGKVRIEINRR